VTETTQNHVMCYKYLAAASRAQKAAWDAAASHPVPPGRAEVLSWGPNDPQNKIE
jgi:hypothetical protein